MSIEAVGNNTSDIRLARSAGGFVYEYWCQGGDIADIEKLLNIFDTMLGPVMLDNDSGGKNRARERVLATINQNAQRANTVVAGQDIWKLPLVEREFMTKRWKTEINPWSLLDQTVEIHSRHLIALDARAQARNEVSKRCLEQRKILMFIPVGFSVIRS